MKKFLLVGLVAACAAAIMVTGCDNGSTSSSGTTTLPGAPITPDSVVSSASAANTAFANGDKVVAIITATSLNEKLVVPEGKTLLVMAALTPASGTILEVEGKVFIVNGSSVTAADADDVVIKGSGNIEVLKGGTLAITIGATDVSDGAALAEEPGTSVTKLGTSAVTFAAGANFTWGATVANAAAITPIWGYMSTGNLTISTLSAGKPSEIVAAISGSSATRTITVTANTDESEASLSIPAGVNLTAKSSDTLAAVTSALEVNGVLDVEAIADSLAIGGDAAVSGTGSIVTAVTTPAKAIALIGKIKSVTVGDVTLVAGTAGHVVTLPADYSVTSTGLDFGAVPVVGTLTAVDAEAVLTPGTATSADLSITGKVLLTGTGIDLSTAPTKTTITGTGTLIIGNGTAVTSVQLTGTDATTITPGVDVSITGLNVTLAKNSTIVLVGGTGGANSGGGAGALGGNAVVTAPTLTLEGSITGTAGIGGAGTVDNATTGGKGGNVAVTVSTSLVESADGAITLTGGIGGTDTTNPGGAGGDAVLTLPASMTVTCTVGTAGSAGSSSGGTGGSLANSNFSWTGKQISLTATGGTGAASTGSSADNGVAGVQPAANSSGGNVVTATGGAAATNSTAGAGGTVTISAAAG